METCCICNKEAGDGQATSRLGVKGCQGLLSASIKNGVPLKASPGDIVHVQCRKDFTRPKTAPSNDNSSMRKPKHVLRSDIVQFDFKNNCLFCGLQAKFNSNKRSVDVYPVRSLGFQESIINSCLSRNDNWSLEVKSRLSHVIDLPAAEAIYHQPCSVNFRTGKDIPKAFQTDNGDTKRARTPGRPENTRQTEGFNEVIKAIQSREKFTITDLVSIMATVCGEDNAYTPKHMKTRVLEHFGEDVVISTFDGKNDIVTLQETVSSIIHNFHEQSKKLSQDEETLHIINTAARLIRNDINAIVDPKECYPSFDDVSSLNQNLDYFPQSLKIFLDVVFGDKSKIKTASIGQAIVQACRPRKLVAPLQLGLGVQLHHQYPSRFLIDTLNAMGFCSSYREVQKYEVNAAAALSTRIPSQEENSPFLQFIADNVDHNIRTIDGHNTFHGMGIIATSTPGSTVSVTVSRKDISLQEIAELGRIDIKYYVHKATSGYDMISFLPLPEKEPSVQCEPLDVLCKAIWPLRQNRPSWSGFMQMFVQNTSPYPAKSSITFMPMIDLSPSDVTCINSTLHFVCKQAERYQQVPVLTFDQPLFQKAFEIICNEEDSSCLKNIILRLGGFHTEMSFLGCIGHLMNGSGLRDVLETVYATNAVTHMLSGKAVQRALRGHMLIDNVLTSLLLDNAQKRQQESLPGSTLEHTTEPNSSSGNPDTSQAQLLAAFEELKNDPSSGLSDDVMKTLTGIQDTQASERQALSGYRTANLWLQYMDMVVILQEFIRAERTGDWNMHLTALRKMLPYFASSGHNLYLKSAYLYLQNMIRLPETNPGVYEKFKAGVHVIRRHDRYWAGVSTDLLIEQTLMRALKTHGGLTRRNGFTENQRIQWLSSMPIRLQMNTSMQKFTETSYESSEQHKETGQARTARDQKDMMTILDHLKERNPFDGTDMRLRNIETGVVADPAVNVDWAESLGETFIMEMAGVTVGSYTFKRSRQVITLATDTGSKKPMSMPSIDTQLLFQRLITVAERYDDDVSGIFHYELSSIPTALFENSGLPREPQKATLADAIWKQGDCSPSDPEIESIDCFVIDGGSLLQKIPWNKGSTFYEICQSYCAYLKRHFKGTISVVFDGYTTGPSTKDVTHHRRTKGRAGPSVQFMANTPCRMQKDLFLSNTENKQAFIFMLAEQLEADGILVRHAEGDADILIGTTALDLSKSQAVAVIGEDTDILVLLCHHFDVKNSKDVIFRSASKRGNSSKEKIWSISKVLDVVGHSFSRCLPLLHALTGCDTTSRLYGISKPAAMKVFKKSSSFRDICHSLLSSEDLQEICRLGEHLIACLYGEDGQLNLDRLRFCRFSKKVISSTTSVQVQTLPPTSAAAKYHILRVYWQCMQWMMKGAQLDPLQYGWVIKQDMMVPVMTDIPPAPENLLQIIHCNCKVNCDTKRCSCRRHGLDCSNLCGQCRGISCSNSLTFEDPIDINDVI